ncbi:polyketide cyclase [Nocardioides oleivorans]|uniref:Polyketide cyclase n=1 Tax=Nocardioides oleivorans TaxID=273676 RepID=A0A4V1RLF4_9ACTN|nr:polyketide cyclase [Nocardioides oleivorans]RYB95592.1 polyketide cyclase [Nocardioides oleivorans]
MIGDRWGVTDEEVRRHYGCDDLVPDPTLEAWRGVSVRATPAAVWARVRQVRLAPYSYDLVDNLGRRSPRDLREVPEPRVGDPFTHALGRPQGRVLAVVSGRELTATITGAHLSYAVLAGAGTPARCRLVLKVVARTSRWLAPAVSVGDLVMARKQLLTLKRLAEADERG